MNIERRSSHCECIGGRARDNWEFVVCQWRIKEGGRCLTRWLETPILKRRKLKEIGINCERTVAEMKGNTLHSYLFVM